MRERILAAYDKLSAFYEQMDDTGSPFNTDYERPNMIRLLPERLTSYTVLDAGCAAGWYTEYLLHAGADVTAMDFSPKMVQATKRRVGDRANVLCHDLADPLPFAHGVFDVIVCSLTLHYLENWLPTFAEFHRVLKPGGLLLYSIHHPFMDFAMFRREDYFLVELLRDEWRKNGERIEMIFYRRPLQNIVNDTLHYFTIEQLVEPQATQGLNMKNPEVYKRLMTTPHFLLIKARKAD